MDLPGYAMPRDLSRLSPLRGQPSEAHAFIDGNKRVGANAAITFLRMNDREPTFDEEELVELVLSLASGRLGKPEVLVFFETHCRPIEGV